MFRYFLYSLYLLIPYLPLFGEIDRIGSQILFISILNFFSIGYIFYLNRQSVFIDLFKTKEIRYYGLFLVMALISGVKAINTSEFLIEFLRTTTYFITLLVFLILVKTQKDKNFLVWIILITLLFDVFGLLIQNFQGLNMIGFTANKNIAAFSLTIKSCYLIYIINKYNSMFIRVILYGLYSLLIFTLIKIGSKGGIIALVFTLFFSLFVGVSSFKKKKSLLSNTLILVIISFFILFVTKLDNRVYDAFVNTTTQFNQDTGNTSRLRYIDQTLKSFQENPFLGVGYGNWKIESIKYDAQDMRDYVVQYYSHNDYLQIIAETGIFGFIFYVLIFTSLITKFVKRFLKFYTLEGRSSLIIFVGAALFVYLFDALINFPWFRATSQLNLILIIVLLNFKQNDEE